MVRSVAFDREHLADSASLDRAHEALLGSLRLWFGAGLGSAYLVRARVAGPPGSSLGPLLPSLGADVLGLVAIVETRPRGRWEHAHLTILVDAFSEAKQAIDSWAERHRFSLKAQWRTKGVTGWPAFVRSEAPTGASLAENLYRILQHDLAVLEYADKRDRELPISALTFGAFSQLSTYLAFALGAPPPPRRLCNAPLPNGETCRRDLTGRQDSCGPTCRSRKSRPPQKRATADDMPRSVAAPAPLALPEVTPNDMSKSVAPSTDAATPDDMSRSVARVGTKWGTAVPSRPVGHGGQPLPVTQPPARRFATSEEIDSYIAAAVRTHGKHTTIDHVTALLDLDDLKPRPGVILMLARALGRQQVNA